MTTAPDENRGWSPLKWVFIIVIIFGLQAGLMFWLGGHHPTSAAPPQPGLTVRLPADPFAEIPGVDDPTLLVTPNARGFSSAWMQAPEMTHTPAEWTGQSNGLLERPIKPLGGEIAALATNNLIEHFSVVDRPEPAAGAVTLEPDATDAGESILTIRGALAGRQLDSPPKLRPQYWDAPLSNSLVEIDVDTDGNVFDPPVILPGGLSGSAETDAYAQEVAQSLRFQALPQADRARSPSAGPRLTSGILVFHWRTQAPVPTNAPAANQ